MQVTIRVDTTGPGLAGLAKQNAFATANAINRTLDEGQILQRSRNRSTFTLRGSSSGFIDRLVKRRREDFAQRDRVVGRLRIEGPEGAEGRGAILARHEDGGLRTTGRGGASVDPRFSLAGYFYLPTKLLRPSFSSVVPRKDYPANLRLSDRADISGTLPAQIHTTSGGKYQLKGKDRTFVLLRPGTGQPIGIFQRNAGRRGHATRRAWGQRDPNLKMLWGFKRQISLPPRLRFVQTQTDNARSRFAINYRGMLSAALRTAR